MENGKLSVFRKMNTLNAKILVKTTPAHWSSPTVLLRLVTQNGIEVMVTLTKDALPADALLVDRIYDFLVPGACVKASTTAIKNGIAGPSEVRCIYPLKATLAKDGWPTCVPYTFVCFADLAQRENDTFLDVLGVVDEYPDIVTKTINPTNAGQSPYTLRTRVVKLLSGEFHELLELQGHQVDTPMKVGDLLAVRGCKVKEYNHKRMLSSGLLTYLETNPCNNPSVPALPKREAGSPTKKATRNTSLLPVSITYVQQLRDQFIEDYKANRASDQEKRDVCIVGKYAAYDPTVFEAGLPFFGGDIAPKIRMKGILLDGQGSLRDVTIWHDAARELFEVDGSTLLGMWEACEDTDKQEDFLQALNKNADKEFKFFCTMRLWTPSAGSSSASTHGSRTDKVLVQINIDAAEAVS